MPPTGNRKMIRRSIPTRDGVFGADYSARGLAQLHFPTGRPAKHQPVTDPASAAVRSWHRATKAALIAVLAGRTPPKLPPLDLLAGTEFQQRVWNELRRIPRGETRSYGEIARALGQPKSARAVGGACGANPLPVLVPCHRVLAATGKLGGFSGGPEWKRRLLGREGITPA